MSGVDDVSVVGCGCEWVAAWESVGKTEPLLESMLPFPISTLQTVN